MRKKNKAAIYLIISLLICWPIAIVRSVAAPRGSAYCRLARDYTPRDGIITCVYAGSFYSFYPHPEARVNRRLPQGIELRVIYEQEPGQWPQWRRLYFW